MWLRDELKKWSSHLLNNLSNCLKWDSNPWPLWCRCSAVTNWAMKPLRCEDHFFNSSLNHTSQTYLSLSIPFIGTHESYKLTWSNLSDFIAQWEKRGQMWREILFWIRLFSSTNSLIIQFCTQIAVITYQAIEISCAQWTNLFKNQTQNWLYYTCPHNHQPEWYKRVCCCPWCLRDFCLESFNADYPDFKMWDNFRSNTYPSK